MTYSNCRNPKAKRNLGRRVTQYLNCRGKRIGMKAYYLLEITQARA